MSMLETLRKKHPKLYETLAHHALVEKLERASDAELLRVPMIGRRSLAIIRRYFYEPYTPKPPTPPRPITCDDCGKPQRAIDLNHRRGSVEAICDDCVVKRRNTPDND